MRMYVLVKVVYVYSQTGTMKWNLCMENKLQKYYAHINYGNTEPNTETL